MALRDNNDAFSVGIWQVHPHENRLVCGDQEVSLEPRLMAVLARLAEVPGQIVSSDELLTTVWHGKPHGDHAVYQAISDLRKSLGDDSSNPRFIETIPKKGYRLVCGTTSILSDRDNNFRHSQYESRSAWPRKRVAHFTGLSALTIALAATLTSQPGDITPEPWSSTELNGGDAIEISASDYLKLSVDHIDRQSLSSLSQALEYANKAIAAEPDIALAYATLAEILVDMHWISREPQLIAKAASAAEFALTLDSDLGSVHRSMGYVGMTRQDLTLAETSLLRATELDPTDERAYSWLAATYGKNGDADKAREALLTGLEKNPDSSELNTQMGLALFQESKENWDRAHLYFQRAIESDADSLQSYIALAVIHRNRGQLAQAIRYGKEAFRLSKGPNRFGGEILAQAYLNIGKFSEATRTIEIMRQANPDSFVPVNSAIQLHISQGNISEAAKLVHENLPKNLNKKGVVSLLAFYELLLGHPEHSADLYESLSQGPGSSGAAPYNNLLRANELGWGMLGAVNFAYLKMESGDTDGANRLLQMSSEFLDVDLNQNMLVRDGSHSYIRSQIAALQNDKNAALDYLQDSVTKGWTTTWYSRIDPVLASIRSEAEFTAIIEEAEQNALNVAREVNRQASLYYPAPHHTY